MGKIVHGERKVSLADRIHVSYSFKCNGYFFYIRYPSWWLALFGWMVKVAGRLPYRRVNDAPYEDEHDTWLEVEKWCAFRKDWHGVGYARAMRHELCLMEDREYKDERVFYLYGEYYRVPKWVNETYLPPAEPENKPVEPLPQFSYRLQRVDIDGTNTYEVRIQGSWEEVFGHNSVRLLDFKHTFEPGQKASYADLPIGSMLILPSADPEFENIITKGAPPLGSRPLPMPRELSREP